MILALTSIVGDCLGDVVAHGSGQAGINGAPLIVIKTWMKYKLQSKIKNLKTIRNGFWAENKSGGCLFL